MLPSMSAARLEVAVDQPLGVAASVGVREQLDELGRERLEELVADLERRGLAPEQLDRLALVVRRATRRGRGSTARSRDRGARWLVVRPLVPAGSRRWFGGGFAGWSANS